MHLRTFATTLLLQMSSLSAQKREHVAAAITRLSDGDRRQSFNHIIAAMGVTIGDMDKEFSEVCKLIDPPRWEQYVAIFQQRVHFQTCAQECALQKPL